MSDCPFDADEVPKEKARFADALFRANAKSPLGANLLKVALSVWPEGEEGLSKALWATHSAKWQNDPEVAEIMAGLEAAAQTAAAEEGARKAAEIETPEFKGMVKAEMIAELRDMVKDRLIDPRDRTGAMDRLSKLMGLDEKPNRDNEDAGRVFGVIHHRLEPMTPDEYADMARQQQRGLQQTVRAKELELEHEHARRIN